MLHTAARASQTSHLVSILDLRSRALRTERSALVCKRVSAEATFSDPCSRKPSSQIDRQEKHRASLALSIAHPVLGPAQCDH
eukprot:6208661-Pleurochrysis_carterae.AAC.1